MKIKNNQGVGLSPPSKNQNRNQFVFLSFGVDPLNWHSFIEVGEMACSSIAWYSCGHTLKLTSLPQQGSSQDKYEQSGLKHIVNTGCKNPSWQEAGRT